MTEQLSVEAIEELSHWDITSHIADLVNCGWTVTVKKGFNENAQAGVVIANKDETFEGWGKTLGAAFNKAVHKFNEYIQHEQQAQMDKLSTLNELITIRSVQQKAEDQAKWQAILAKKTEE